MKSNPEWGKIDKQSQLAFLLTSLLLILNLALLTSSKTVKKSFAIETFNLGVYWDSNCNQEITEINWGNLTPSSTRNINIYIRNEEIQSPCFLFLWTKNWTPPQALRYITLSWDYKNRPINPNEAILVVLTLKIAPHISEIVNFNFVIIILGTENIIGDMNSDGTVDVLDAVKFSISYGSTPSDPNWNPLADINTDYSVNILDATMFGANYRASMNN